MAIPLNPIFKYDDLLILFNIMQIVRIKETHNIMHNIMLFNPPIRSSYSIYSTVGGRYMRDEAGNVYKIQILPYLSRDIRSKLDDAQYSILLKKKYLKLSHNIMEEYKNIENNTDIQYRGIIDRCRSLFMKKHEDYGSSWRILRPKSVTDQIYIKAKRIRTLEETGVNKVGESIESELIGIINYSIVGIAQLKMAHTQVLDLEAKQVSDIYDDIVLAAFNLMKDKNHDYGEAWREMRNSSITDLILSKIHRIKQIEDNNGKTSVSEGIDAGYYDILNYAVFYSIKMK